MAQVLILAYGNPFRCDDGIAWRAAEELRRRLPSSQAEIVSLQQLTPELAERASHASAVIFLDASRDAQAGTIRCEPVSSSFDDSHCSHDFAPQAIVALCEKLYGIKSRAFVISMSGECFDHGETISQATARALPHFVAVVCELIERFAPSVSRTTEGKGP